MEKYELQISRSAEKQLKQLSSENQRRIADAILTLADEPRPRGARKLAGYEDVFRIRVGTFRILYSVSETEAIIVILKVGHRRDVYR